MNLSLLIIFLTLLNCSLLGCSQTPAKRTLSICPNCISHTLNSSGPHPIQAYFYNIKTDTISTNIQKESTLHVYLEGDGLPWHPRGYQNPNPNSHKLTALKLMKLDSHPSVYINRPCYGYAEMPDICSPNLWTSGRYSELVIHSINQAINNIQTTYNFKNLALIGHSGGGTIAMLIANRRNDIAAVITLGANLDHKAWTEHFGYLPLSSSLNPSQEETLPQHVLRWHFVGSKDTQVPMQLTQNVVHKDPYAKLFIKKEYNHTCCWADDWPETLKNLHYTLQSLP